MRSAEINSTEARAGLVPLAHQICYEIWARGPVSLFVTARDNKPDAYGLERAKKAGIKNISINHKNFSSREEFDAKLTLELEKEKVDIICLAGFMRLLTAIFINRWQGKIINIHPSLLPAFKGVDAIKQAFDYGVKITGVSVHYVVQEMDSGEIILQKPIAIGSRETLEQLEKKVHKLEHSLYPKALLLVIKKIL